MKRFEKTRAHLREHKATYLKVTGGAVVVFVAGMLVGQRRPDVVVDSYNLKINSPTHNLVEVTMIRPGPKSFVVQCIEDQKTYPSLREAARNDGVSPGLISGHLKGDIPDVNGKHYAKLAEV